MPLYEYRDECGIFEDIKKMSDPPFAVCPKCGKEAGKIMSAPRGFKFVGPGFYATDYKDGSGGFEAKSESKAGVPHPNSKGDDMRGVKYNDNSSGNCTGPDYQMGYTLKT